MPIVGEYDLVQKLGHGSYADVFKGIHIPSNQRFAVKAISKGIYLSIYLGYNNLLSYY